jgi:hypothetical protein
VKVVHYTTGDANMRTRTLYLAAVLAALPAGLAAQDSTGTTSARLTATLETAMEAGIPVSLLERKIAEGRAKGVVLSRIEAAVDARLQALAQARDAMVAGGMRHTTEGELSVAADAIQSGVSATALTAISRTAPEGRRAVAFAVLSDLVVSGRTSDQAALQVQQALEAGPEALANLSAGVGAGAGVQGGQAGGVQVDAVGSARVNLGGARRN